MFFAKYKPIVLLLVVLNEQSVWTNDLFIVNEFEKRRSLGILLGLLNAVTKPGNRVSKNDKI